MTAGLGSGVSERMDRTRTWRQGVGRRDLDWGSGPEQAAPGALTQQKPRKGLRKAQGWERFRPGSTRLSGRLGKGWDLWEALSIQRPAAVSQGTSGRLGIFQNDPTLCLLGRCKTRGQRAAAGVPAPAGKESSSPTSLPWFTWEEGGALAASDPRSTGFPTLAPAWWAELGPSDREGHQDALCGLGPGGRGLEGRREMGVLAACPSGLAPNSCQEHTPCSCPHPHSSRKRRVAPAPA